MKVPIYLCTSYICIPCIYILPLYVIYLLTFLGLRHNCVYALRKRDVIVSNYVFERFALSIDLKYRDRRYYRRRRRSYRDASTTSSRGLVELYHPSKNIVVSLGGS